MKHVYLELVRLLYECTGRAADWDHSVTSGRGVMYGAI